MIFPTPDPSAAAGSYPVLLFEEALAAGKIPAGTLTDSDGDGKAAFAANDTFSVYVTYTLTKKRKFMLDAAQGSGVAKITVGGVELSAAGVEETAEPVVHKVEWQFKHAA